MGGKRGTEVVQLGARVKVPEQLDRPRLDKVHRKFKIKPVRDSNDVICSLGTPAKAVRRAARVHFLRTTNASRDAFAQTFFARQHHTHPTSPSQIRWPPARIPAGTVQYPSSSTSVARLHCLVQIASTYPKAIFMGSSHSSITAAKVTSPAAPPSTRPCVTIAA
jgi:hypothetical protein